MSHPHDYLGDGGRRAPVPAVRPGTQVGQVFYLPQGEQLYPNSPPNLIRFDLSHDIIKYDNDNLLPDRLAMMYQLAPTLGGVLNRLAGYVYGEGLEIECQDAEELKRASKWASYWGNQMGASEIFRRHALDYLIYGGFSAELAWYKSNALASVFYADWSALRYGFGDSPEGVETHLRERCLYLSAKWAVYQDNWSQFKKEKVRLYMGQPSEENSFLYYRRYTPGFDYYPLPMWFSAYSSAVLEYQLNKFLISLSLNGFAPAGMLILPQGVDPKTVTDARNELNANRGVDNAGRTIVTMGNETDRGNYVPFAVNPFDKDVSMAYDQARQNIITACGVPSPALIGLPGGASLGGDGGTMESASKILMSRVIKPIQSEILSEYNDLLIKAGFQGCKFTVRQTEIAEGQAEAPALGTPAASGAAQSPSLIEQQSKAELRGSVGGVQALLQLVQEVNLGTVSRQSAKAIMDTIYGIGPTEADGILGPPITPTKV